MFDIEVPAGSFWTYVYLNGEYHVCPIINGQPGDDCLFAVGTNADLADRIVKAHNAAMNKVVGFTETVAA